MDLFDLLLIIQFINFNPSIEEKKNLKKMKEINELISKKKK